MQQISNLAQRGIPYCAIVLDNSLVLVLWTGRAAGAQTSRIRMVQKGVPPFGVLYAVLPCNLHKSLFPGLEPMTFQSHDNNFTVAPRLPLVLLWTGIRGKPVLYDADIQSLSCFTGIFLII